MNLNSFRVLLLCQVKCHRFWKKVTFVTGARIIFIFIIVPRPTKKKSRTKKSKYFVGQNHFFCWKTAAMSVLFGIRTYTIDGICVLYHTETMNIFYDSDWHFTWQSNNTLKLFRFMIVKQPSLCSINWQSVYYVEFCFFLLHVYIEYASCPI